MTDVTPKRTPTGTSAEPPTGTPNGTPAGETSPGAPTGTPGGTDPGSGAAPDRTPGTRARPLTDKAVPGATGGRGQERPAPPAPAVPSSSAGTRVGPSDDRTTGQDRTAGQDRTFTDDGATGRGGGDAGRDTTDRLLPRDECDRLADQMRHAVAGFVDEPGAAVQEADRVLEEAAARFTDAVTRRRSSLRRAWQSAGEGREGRSGGSGAGNADTEALRLALRDYRELTDRLLSR
jgi:hypothetical protein